MTITTVSSQIDSKVAERAMLSHPFYQAWTEGRLPIDTLRAYSRQTRLCSTSALSWTRKKRSVSSSFTS